jgi:hypothetical protein
VTVTHSHRTLAVTSTDREAIRRRAPTLRPESPRCEGRVQLRRSPTARARDRAWRGQRIPLRAILRGALTEESTTPNLLELARRNLEAVNRGDLDAAFRNWAPGAVWDDWALGLGTHEGLAAIRQHAEEWRRAYEEFEIATEEQRDLGNGLTFSVSLQKGRPVGSTGYVQLRYAVIAVWEEDMLQRFTTYTDIDEARAAAERLAQERG